jgi:hypothetical protein
LGQFFLNFYKFRAEALLVQTKKEYSAALAVLKKQSEANQFP